MLFHPQILQSQMNDVLHHSFGFEGLEDDTIRFDQIELKIIKVLVVFM